MSAGVAGGTGVSAYTQGYFYLFIYLFIIDGNHACGTGY
jgi:hypothetical protein